ncbi:MAG: hypothetical protein E4G94_00765 [ANME-2 cluster archaeon]|nr:MAG: hypothetical protein E4G94_00765 [ANME-2 cluster archaeon]
MKIINDDRAVTVTIESVLLFSITVLLLGMVMLSFQSINNQASETVMREQYGSIGNDVASKILDLDIEVKASLSQGSVVAIENELNLKPLVANNPYSIELDVGKVIVQSLGGPSVTIEVPFNPSLNIVSGSTIYSTAAEHALMYDSNGQIMFKNGGVDAVADDQWPIIYFDTPEAMASLNGTVTINVFTLDNVEVSKVEYFIGENYETTVGAPFEWEWDTMGISDGTYTITAIAYDRAGHYSYDTRNFKVYNGLDLEAPTIEVISPGSSTDFVRPPIEVMIRDNIAVDSATIYIELNGDDITDNVTITNTTLREYRVVYTLAEDLSGSNNLYVFAREKFYGSGEAENKNVSLNHNFTIDPMNDNNDPAVEITFPQYADNLVTGDNIEVSFVASDLTYPTESGIDYIMIDVSNGITNYTHRENVSYYSNVISTVSPTWTFTNKLSYNVTYTYYVTIFDRIGKNTTATVGPFRVGSSSASSVVTDTPSLSNKRLSFNIYNSDPSLPAYFESMNVTFDVGELYDISGAIDWGGANLSIAQVEFTPSILVPSTSETVILSFRDAISSYTIVINFADGSS